MSTVSIFIYEWKHFVRRPFKVVALGLFIVAAVYGLHNGAKLYHGQVAEIESIRIDNQESRQEYLAYYENGQTGPENRPWIDVTTPFWAIWYNYIHYSKEPSPAMVYSIGQAEQYGFYKRVTFWASPYDADMAEELANPERLQTGTLDFTFALLFLLPLLLLILVYNLKSMEAEQGFLPLIEVQTASKETWLLTRFTFYLTLSFFVIVGLLLYGAALTGVFLTEGDAFGQMLLYSFLYLLLWSVIYYLILRGGSSILGNTLKMAGIWLALAFIIPAAVQQWVSIEKPTNLMTEFIDASRDELSALFDQPDSVLQGQLNTLFPEIINSPVAMDSLKKKQAMNSSSSALANELSKASIEPIEAENQARNQLIRWSYPINPVVFFQNKFNSISETHYNDYQAYRDTIQSLIDKQIRTLVLDTWNGVTVDQQQFEEYHEKLSEL